MRKTIAAVAAAGALLTLGAGTASAGWSGDYLDDGVRIRATPVSGTVKGVGYPGHGVCTTVAQKASDGYYWGYHRNLRTKVVGWSRGDLLSVTGGC